MNWARNVAFERSRTVAPSSTAEVAAEVLRCGANIRALGAGHSFSRTADTRGLHILTHNLQEISLDAERGTVTVGAGVTFESLAVALRRAKRAIANGPSLASVTVVGCISTGSHGTGWDMQILASLVVAMEIVTADGKVRRFEGSEVAAVVLDSGTLGVVCAATLRTVPEFMVHKAIYTGCSWDTFVQPGNVEEVFRAADFVSVFCDFATETKLALWLGHRATTADGSPPLGNTFLGARHIKAERVHPVPGQDPSACVTVGNGLWMHKIFHFLPGQVASSGEGNEIQTEYFVPFRDAQAALEAIFAVRATFNALLQICELRVVAGDTIPLSPAHGQRVLAIHFTWIADLPRVLRCLPIIEQSLAPFNPKPHLGKVFTLGRASLDRAFGDDLRFHRSVALELDATGRFANDFSRRLLGNYLPALRARL